jgi:hypothetical protein
LIQEKMMRPVRTPILTTVPIIELRPTQITVGMREVEAKRRRWRERSGTSDEKAAKFLGRHMLPVILGPKDRHYIIDHHHLSRALLEEGVKEVLVTVVAKLSRLEKDEFWVFIDNRGWLHPFDEEGRRRSSEELPKTVGDLIDDPFRSLAGELRRIGGFAKDTTPFSEFLWADFLRRRVKRKLLEDNFDEALEQAARLAKAQEADHLPGWCGPVPRE